MKVSKFMYLLMAALVLGGLPAIASNGGIDILTNHLYTLPYSASICADIDPDAAGIPVSFRAVTPWGTTRAAGPASTNSLGTACVKVVWPEGIYTLQASTNGMTSDPKAIAFFNPRNFCGAISSGELHLFQYGVYPKSDQYTQDFRVATAAMIFREPIGYQRCPTFGVIYYDLDNPLGAVSFTTKSFQVVDRGAESNPDYEWFEFWGTGYFQQGDGPRMLVKYNLYVDDYPNDNWFCLDIYDLTGKLIYEVDNCHLYKGKTVTELCTN